jgi:hypothetical protein
LGFRSRGASSEGPLREYEIRSPRPLRPGGARFLLQADFVAYDPKGQIVIIEAKTWPPARQNLDRAAEEASLYCRAARASEAFVVLDRIERKQPYPNVVSVEELPRAIALAFASPAPASQSVHEFHPHERIIFAAMPFSSEYDDVFFIAMSHAAKTVNAACKRVGP